MTRHVKLARPIFKKKDFEFIEEKMHKILESGWLTSGRYVEELEKGFTKLVGTRHAIATTNATSALHAMMASLDPSREDEVVVPANTFASTANAALYVGARPVLADCDAESFNVSAETIAPQITEKTRAVIVTHIGGNPCEMDPIVSLCKSRGLVLIEDSAHATGSRYRGKPCGSFSLGSAFSMYPNKIITSAEGGVICTDSDQLDRFSRTFRNVGRVNFGDGPIVMLGYNYRMSDVHAAIGLSQLRHVEGFVNSRNRLAEKYTRMLEETEWLEPQKVSTHSYSSYYAYIVKLSAKAPISRDKLAVALKAKGIGTTVIYTPLNQQPYFARFSRRTISMPNAEAIGSRSLALPLHPGMTADDVSYVVKAIRSVAPK
ncbi:MAG: DegT/DnrJ/EryC1/StrS family aminotransferase [Thaumarchaeota archaeon]|nr:DegT/DnrJ/EryC1/StrS family aminotransferase [Nitrososphaerota archaeon]